MQIAVAGIVLNGEPFLDAWKEQALYITKNPKFIYLTEGACNTTDQFGYGVKSGLFCDQHGHSIDNTFNWAKNSNVNLIYRDEMWPNKLEMFKAQEPLYKDIDFVWEIDIDEFYQKEDIDKILDYLSSLNKPLLKMSIPGYQFWGDYHTAIKAPNGEWGDFVGDRIFSWNSGSQWVNHRPPTVANNAKLIFDASKLNVKMFHYSYCTKKQIEFKAEYYKSQYPQKEKCFRAILNNKLEYLNSVKYLSPNAGLFRIETRDHPIWTKDKIDGWENF